MHKTINEPLKIITKNHSGSSSRKENKITQGMIEIKKDPSMLPNSTFSMNFALKGYQSI